MSTRLEGPVQPFHLDESAAGDPEPETNKGESVTVEEFKISGDALVTTIKDLIHQGNIRRITIKNETGSTLIEIPLTVGVLGGAIGAALFPVIAAVGVIGAMVTHITITIERHDIDQPSDSDQN